MSHVKCLRVCVIIQGMIVTTYTCTKWELTAEKAEIIAGSCKG
jgi:hypothetical protein